MTHRLPGHCVGPVVTAQRTGRRVVGLWSLFRGVSRGGFWQRPLPSLKVFLQILKAEWGEVRANPLAHPPLALGSVLAAGEAELVPVMFSSNPPAGHNVSAAVSASPAPLHPEGRPRPNLPPELWVEPHQLHDANIPRPVTDLGCKTGTLGPILYLGT